MSQRQLPSSPELRRVEAELRAKYGPRVSIRYDLPSKAELYETKSFFSKLGQSLRIQRWMWASVTGVMLGIFVVPPTVNSIIDFWQPKVVAGYELAGPYLSTDSKLAVDYGEDVVAFLAQPKGPFEPNMIDRAAIAPLDRPRSFERQAEQVQLFKNTFPFLTISATVYRIVSARYGDPLLSLLDRTAETGAQSRNPSDQLLDAVRRHGGRIAGPWNLVGTAVLYASSTRAR